MRKTKTINLFAWPRQARLGAALVRSALRMGESSDELTALKRLLDDALETW